MEIGMQVSTRHPHRTEQLVACCRAQVLCDRRPTSISLYFNVTTYQTRTHLEPRLSGAAQWKQACKFPLGTRIGHNSQWPAAGHRCCATGDQLVSLYISMSHNLLDTDASGAQTIWSSSMEMGMQVGPGHLQNRKQLLACSIVQELRYIHPYFPSIFNIKNQQITFGDLKAFN